MCTSRLYIHSSIAEEFTKLYQKAIEAQASVIGSAMDEKTTHGPQVDKIQHDKIKHYIEVGKTEGNVLLGGQNLNQDVSLLASAKPWSVVLILDGVV